MSHQFCTEFFEYLYSKDLKCPGEKENEQNKTHIETEE